MNWFILFLQIIVLGIAIFFVVRDAIRRKKNADEILPKEVRDQASNLIRNINKTSFDNVTLIESKIRELQSLIDIAEDEQRNLISQPGHLQELSVKTRDEEYIESVSTPVSEPQPIEQKHTVKPGKAKKTASARKKTVSDVKISSIEITPEERPKKRNLPENRQERFAMISSLAQEGMDPAGIASELDLTIAEVTTYLQIYQNN